MATLYSYNLLKLVMSEMRGVCIQLAQHLLVHASGYLLHDKCVYFERASCLVKYRLDAQFDTSRPEMTPRSKITLKRDNCVKTVGKYS